eukprot:5738181-Prymnesium_polylepis.1
MGAARLLPPVRWGAAIQRERQSGDGQGKGGADVGALVALGAGCRVGCYAVQIQNKPGAPDQVQGPLVLGARAQAGKHPSHRTTVHARAAFVGVVTRGP